ncbi:MAG: N(4)-(beta-N-acetylglucosaminyl)-L-asparaginase [Planctomycetota bacterium]|jgi:beta-aspartyl-peptidase (threonine type)
MDEKTHLRIAVTLNGREATQAGMDVLRDGGSALDAVETAVRKIEENPDDWSVGYGGFPNFAGNVELDASIMDGQTLAGGAVAGMRRHIYAVSVARRIMEKTPHVLLVGEGADQFADAEGFESADLLTERTREAYQSLMRGETIRLWQRVPEETVEGALRYGERLLQVTKDRQGWKEIYCAELQGTCNAIAIDEKGDMASAVSTSGLALKMPGRVGDSPILGAGNYADNRYGAAGCAGNGELVMRLGSTWTAVNYMREGMDARAASEQAIRDLEQLPDRQGGFQILTMKPDGDAWCASNIKEPEYFLMDANDPNPRRVKGSFIELP